MTTPPMIAIAEALRRARRVLVASHVSPDIDGAGSLLALGLILDRLQVEHVLHLQDGVPQEARQLARAGEVTKRVTGEFDLAVVLDCPVLARIGDAAERLGDTPVVNIDHHTSNTYFGEHNLVDAGMASTAQLVLRLAWTLGLSLTTDLATCILAAVVGDTQGLRTPSTDERVLSDVGTLVDAGADLWQANQWVFNSRPRGHISLWGQALSGAVAEDGLVWCVLTQAMRRKARVPEEDTAGLVNFLIGTRGTAAAAVFSERSDGTVDVNLRSLPGVDVAEVAIACGGGGHRLAAGCTVPGSLAEVRDRVLELLRQAVDGASVRRAASR